MTSSSQDLWDEFDWERELRKDDGRIHTYLAELPSFIDLPGEEDLIYKRIQRHEELVPHGGVWPADPWGQDPDDRMKDPRQNNRYLWRGKVGADIFISAVRTARSLCMLNIMDPALTESDAFVRMQCHLGKLNVYLADILNLMPAEYPALRIALCKRCLSAVNEITGLLQGITSAVTMPEAESLLEALLLQFGNIRERIQDLLARIRRAGSLPLLNEDEMFPGDGDEEDDEPPF